MRVSHVFIVLGMIRVLSHEVVAGAFANLLPVEHDAEPSEKDVFQLDGGRNDTECLLLEVERQILKFLPEGRDVVRDFSRGGNLPLRRSLGELIAKGIEPASEVRCRKVQVGDQTFGSCHPALVASQLEAGCGASKLLPLVVVKDRERTKLARSNQVLVDLDSGPQCSPP